MIDEKKINDIGDILRMDFKCCVVIGFDLDGNSHGLLYSTDCTQLEDEAISGLVKSFANDGGIEEALYPSTIEEDEE